MARPVEALDVELLCKLGSENLVSVRGGPEIVDEEYGLTVLVSFSFEVKTTAMGDHRAQSGQLRGCECYKRATSARGEN